MHGSGPQHHWVRESSSVWFWGIVLPFSAAVILPARRDIALLLLGAYPVLLLKIYACMRMVGRNHSDSILYAAFCILGKFPMALGQLKFHWGMWFGRRERPSDYKSA